MPPPRRKRAVRWCLVLLLVVLGGGIAGLVVTGTAASPLGKIAALGAGVLAIVTVIALCVHEYRQLPEV